MVCELGMARPEVHGDQREDERVRGHGLSTPLDETRGGGRIVGAAGLNVVG